MRQLEKELELERLKREISDKRKEEVREEPQRREFVQEKDKVAGASAIVIGNDFSNPDPVSIMVFLFIFMIDYAFSRQIFNF